MAGQTFSQKIKVHLDGAKKAGKDANNLNNNMKKLGKSVLAAGAAYFGSQALLSGMKKSIELALKQQALARPFETLNRVMGGSVMALDKYRRAVNGTISDTELMRIANQAMTLGVAESDDAMAELFDTAQRLGKSLGVDTEVLWILLLLVWVGNQ